MRPFLLKTTLWLAIFFLILVSVGRLDNRARGNANVLRVDQLGSMTDLDILFVGNSYAHSGINPLLLDEVGLETYCLGIDSAGVAFYDLLLDDYLAQTGSVPETIMLLVSPMTFSHNADNFPSIPIHRYLHRPVSNETVALRYDAPYARLLRHSFRKGLGNLGWRSDETRLDDHDEAILNHRGFTPSVTAYSGVTHPKIRAAYATLIEDRFPDDELADLLDQARSLRRRGARVMFYELPDGGARDWFHQDFLDRYESSLNELTAMGFPVLRVRWDTETSDFRNVDHLSTSGAALATRELAKRYREVRAVESRADLAN